MDRNIIGCPMLINSVVALRKESVDRNSIKSANSKACITSLSARRAWIEMEYTLYCPPFGEVALRKESVDRNRYHRDDVPDFRCRSPQGERG